MSMPRLLLGAALAATLTAGLTQVAHAATAWNETVSGDLANVGTSPTAVSLVAGSNLMIGTTGRPGGGAVDRDYFSFTLPAGFQLDTVTLLDGVFLGPGSASFIGVQAGPQVTVNPTGGSATGLLGWVHYGENDIGTDVLGLMGIGFGATGFAGSLPAGTYSFWIQETGNGTAAYRFDFGVSVVPEPASALLLLGGVAGLLAARRLRRG